MSELTQCNFCHLQAIKERYKDHRIQLEASHDWIEVCVDFNGKKQSVASFLALTFECVCNE